MSGKTATELVSLIRRLSVLTQQTVDLRVKSYGLTGSQYVVLSSLGEGHVTTKELAADTHLAPTILTASLDTLVQKGLAHREETVENGESHAVSLTVAGEELLGVVASPDATLEYTLRQDIDPGDVHILKAVGHQLIKNLEQELHRQEHGLGI